MPKYLYEIPDLVILVGFTILVPAYAYILYSGLRFIFRKRELPHDAYLGINMFNSTIAISAFLLTFTLVQAFGTIQNINSEISEETAIIEQLDRFLISIRDSESMDIRDKLKQYIRSVITKEWMELRSESGRFKVSKEFTDLFNAATHALTLSTTQHHDLYEKSVTHVEELGRLRHHRMKHVGKGISPIFFFGIFLLITTSILFFFYLSKKNVFSANALLFQMTALGTLCGLIVVYDQPFNGESGVTAKAYERTLEMMDERIALYGDHK